MNKKEFLEDLRQSLEGEVSSSVIDQNIQYYNQYISSKTVDDEERIIEELGNPRLIAKTIIESERAARQKGYYRGADSFHTNYQTTDEDDSDSKDSNSRNSGAMFHLSWMQKISLIITIVIIIIILILIGKMIIGFLFAFGVPIILILLLMALFKKRS